jgi:hypothetical protein
VSQLCNVTRVEVAPDCSQATPACGPGEVVNITVFFENYSYCLAGNYIQIDMSNPSCLARFSGGDFQGVGGFLTVDSDVETTYWTVPSIPENCEGVTLTPENATLAYNNGTHLTLTLATTSNVEGSITLANVTEQFCGWIDLANNYSCQPPPFSPSTPQRECDNSSWCVFDDGSGAQCYPPGTILQTNTPGENYSIICKGPEEVDILGVPYYFNVWCPTAFDGTPFDWDEDVCWPDPINCPYQGACIYPRQQCYEPGYPLLCNYLISDPNYWFDPDCFFPGRDVYPNAPPPVLNQTTYGWNASCCAYEIGGYPFYDYGTVQVY